LFSAGKKFERVFGQDLEEIAFFGRLQQIAEEALFKSSIFLSTQPGRGAR
jgi:hypothetical protein